jgi:polysaccharide biosynthesis protein PslG
VIHSGEIWNEPNHRAYWGAPPDGKEYGRLVRRSALVIREVDPSAHILAGALAGLDPEFTGAFLDGGVDTLIHIITFHNYAALPEERIYKALEVWKVINAHNPNLELWQGECGYPSHSSTRDFR